MTVEGAGRGPWDEVVGQPAAVAILRGAVARDEVPHAWLLVGPAGVGQREAVRALAADLNCPRATAGTPACGSCSTCRRLVAGTHPAIRDLEPEGAAHVVDAVRDDWIPTANRSLVEGRRRVLRVVAADRMNEGAQNAFLKVLEEPPPSVVWVLEAEEPDALLETVVSRCRRVDLTPWTPADLAAHAERLGVPPGERDVLVRASMGLPARLADLADVEVDRLIAARRARRDESGARKPTDDELGQLRHRLSAADARRRHLAIVGRLADQGPGRAVALAAEITGWAKARQEVRAEANRRELDRLDEAFGGEWPPGVRTRTRKRHDRLEREERRRALQLALDDLSSYLRDLLALQAGADVAALVNVDAVAALRRDAGRVPPAVALDGLAGAAECADALDGYGQPELHLERLLLRLAIGLYAPATGTVSAT